jgi:hypothetical protein
MALATTLNVNRVCLLAAFVLIAAIVIGLL